MVDEVGVGLLGLDDLETKLDRPYSSKKEIKKN